MSDSTDSPSSPPKNQDAQEPAAETAPEVGELSIEEINHLIAAEDPEFMGKLAELQSIPSVTDTPIESLAIESTLSSQEGIPEAAKKLSWKERRALWWIAIKSFPKKVIMGLKSALVAVFKYLGRFKTLSGKNKLRVIAILALVTVIALAAVKFDKIVTGSWLSFGPIQSLDEVADQVYQIEHEEEFVEFMSASRRPHYYLKLPRIKIRLKSEKPDQVAFATFEVILESSSKEAGVELNQKQSLFLDHAQRVAEELTATEWMSAEGKIRYKNQLKQIIDAELTTGFIVDTFLDNLVVSP